MATHQIDIQRLLSDVEEYARKRGIAPSTVFQYGAGSWRYLDRLRRRARELESVEKRVREYMMNNPPEDGQPDAA